MCPRIKHRGGLLSDEGGISKRLGEMLAQHFYGDQSKEQVMIVLRGKRGKRDEYGVSARDPERKKPLEKT